MPRRQPPPVAPRPRPAAEPLAWLGVVLACGALYASAPAGSAHDLECYVRGAEAARATGDPYQGLGWIYPPALAMLLPPEAIEAIGRWPAIAGAVLLGWACAGIAGLPLLGRVVAGAALPWTPWALDAIDAGQWQAAATGLAALACWWRRRPGWCFCAATASLLIKPSLVVALPAMGAAGVTAGAAWVASLLPWPALSWEWLHLPALAGSPGWTFAALELAALVWALGGRGPGSASVAVAAAALIAVPPAVRWAHVWLWLWLGVAGAVALGREAVRVRGRLPARWWRGVGDRVRVGVRLGVRVEVG